MQYSAVGSQFTFFGRLNSVGYLMGTTGTIAPGSDAGMGRLVGVESVNLNVPEARAVPIPGDNNIKGTILIPSNNAPEGAIVTTVADLTFETTAQALNTVDIGNATTQLLGPGCPTFTPLCLIVNSPALDQTPGNVGAPGWHAYVFLKDQVQPRAADNIQNGNAFNFPHRIVATYADTTFWGATVDDLGYGSATGLIIDMGWTPYPWTAHTFVGNNSATTFTLDETPSGEDGDNVVLYQAGVELVYGSGSNKYQVVASTKTVTMGTAAGASVPVVLLYQFVPFC